MKEEKEMWTIVHRFCAYEDYPFIALDERTLRLLRAGAATTSRADRITFPAVLKLLECFLRISAESQIRNKLTDGEFGGIATSFVGALFSKRFVALSEAGRYKYAVCFRNVITALSKAGLPLAPLPFALSTVSRCPLLLETTAAFEAKPLVEEEVWLWRGWSSQNASGRTTWFPLYPVYKRLGRAFTARLHQLCDEFFRKRKIQHIVSLPDLCTFIGQYPQDITPNHFKSPEFVTKFWREFLVFYVRSGYANGLSVSHMVTGWRSEFTFFVQQYLVGSGFISAAHGEFPMPPSMRTYGPRTHIRKTSDGTEVKAKLLTDIPLQLTDTEAMELLFRRLQDNLDTALTWARHEADDLWQRHMRRNSIAPLGTPRTVHKTSAPNGGRWLTSRDNPEHLQNAAATFALHGYLTNQDATLHLMYPLPLPQSAIELGLPTSSSLLPHCTILVATHPSITASFLETLELFDQSGRFVGLTNSDGNQYLVGYKARNGPRAARQVVQLTAETARTVEQIIAVTEPLRNYLRGRGDDSWRFLLLSCEKGFAHPKRIKRIATDTSLRYEALARSLGKTSSMSLDQRIHYAKRFSLGSLRATAAVLIYIKTRDATKMSVALGHTEYSSKLLTHYLPDPILSFFQERWIRIFQAGIIAESLKDSSLLLGSTSFASMEELDHFLANHALNLTAFNQTGDSVSNGSSSHSEVVFGVSPPLLTTLLSLQLAVESGLGTPSGRAIYWSEITKRLVSYLDSAACCRHDLKSYLEIARQNANADIGANLAFQ